MLLSCSVIIGNTISFNEMFKMYTKDFEPYKYPLNRHNRNNFNIRHKSKWLTQNNDSDVHIKSKINKKKKIGNKWRRMLNDYSQNSTLHGLRYAGNNELSASER